ncbi:MAG: GlmU family protein [Bacteroidales bacterium]|jgi:UDP-N-acetylglucosamine diphosphorylase/glucosamine-1-phosphate N-acetyltransferase|nr:GlmU family protein [Bacteroidales bacterium]
MNIVLFDNDHRGDLLPLTFTRPQADIRVGILTIREKWEKRLGCATSTHTQAYLSQKYPVKREENSLFISASVCPTDKLVQTIQNLHAGQTLIQNETVIAHCSDEFFVDTGQYYGKETVEFEEEYTSIDYLWDIFAKNEQELHRDFDLLTRGRKSHPLSSTNSIIAPENIFAEEGVKAECAVINARDAKVYIGKNVEIMEGSLLRGSIALCESTQVKMGAKIYGGTTIGPFSKVGGELNNVVIFGYSNKAHDGFLGNSVLGEWCNIGADTNTSNLKNNYDMVRLWNYKTKTFQKTNLQFCGLIMGDHSKSGINVMFNTGTVVGVSANVFGAGYQRNFYPSFHWGGGTTPVQNYKLDVAIDVAKRVYARRNREFTDMDGQILYSVHNLTEEFRKMGDLSDINR